MILDDFPYLTVTATCSGEHTSCCDGFDTGELAYGAAFQSSAYADSGEEHVSRSYVSSDVKDGCYRTVTLEAVTKAEGHPGIALEGLYLSEGRSQGFDSGGEGGSTPAVSVGKFFYIGNIAEISQAELSENSLVLSASAADYTVTVKLSKESAANGLEAQTAQQNTDSEKPSSETPTEVATEQQREQVEVPAATENEQDTDTESSAEADEAEKTATENKPESDGGNTEAESSVVTGASNEHNIQSEQVSA